MSAEHLRLQELARRERDWARWGPYLSERQWATVREDYSASGDTWSYFPHDHARSRAYRWGEDGLLGICDRKGRLAFAIALWNGRDPILKERLFGLAGPEGNHGEDVKELYHYLDSTPTHSYMKALYRYPQGEFPYARLVEESQRRGREEREVELIDTGLFDEGRSFDVFVEYAKASPQDLLIRLTVANRGPEAAEIHLLPTLWFRNTWSWGREGEGYGPRPVLREAGGQVVADHPEIGRMHLRVEAADAELLFTENETDTQRLYDWPNRTPFVKDAFHERVVQGRTEAVNPEQEGTKAAFWIRRTIPAGGETVLRLRLTAERELAGDPFGVAFEAALAARLAEADAFYDAVIPAATGAEERRVSRQAYAGLLWSKQFYHYVAAHWLEGDPSQPAPPTERSRNRRWRETLYNRDILSMPDKWEYPYYCAWDSAFHMVPMAQVDPAFARDQLLLFLREWYLHPNGQIPAYEFAFDDVNPPVHAWAALQVFRSGDREDPANREFLEAVFHKLLLNFTWWVNQKDADGNNVFGGGFLGLDNIGVFDRSNFQVAGGRLEQSDGTSWVAFYSLCMLDMAVELARGNPAYDGVASKFFEHFAAVAEAMNALGGTGLWDDEDGFYYDILHQDGRFHHLKVRSLVGLMPLVATFVLEDDELDRLPGFSRRMRWFLRNRPDLARQIVQGRGEHPHRLLALAPRERLVRVLGRMLDEDEFLSPFGIRSLSRCHLDQPYTLHLDGREFRVDYTPGESTSGMFGGNSNWRGPVWFPLNYLLIGALERFHHFYGEDLRVECPTGSGHWMTLQEVADELRRRLVALFLPDAEGRRPCHGEVLRYATDPAWRDLVLFYEHFHGDTGRGLGASHQTGWTALAASCIHTLGVRRSGRREPAGIR